MLVASILLAAIVVAVFVALIFAVSAARNATNDEARSKNVTVSALALEKLVLDLEAGLRGYVITGNPDFLTPYTTARRQLKESKNSTSPA